MGDDLGYQDGLRFECLRCGGCCSGFSGTVRVTDDEIVALAQRLNLPEAEFRKRYTRAVGGGIISLIEKENKDCIFFDKEQGCTVYADRPRQCLTWPFWRSNIYSPERWKRGAERCPGMDRGRLHGVDLIKEMGEYDGSSGMVS
ncbi:MAG: YkgJ family cysteine cluster protein [Desulfobacterales bacterium]|nr:YkgJ family cysteine cluster protein [Desulfobacterales bacterium]